MKNDVIVLGKGAEDLRRVLRGAPSFLWVILIVGALLAIQLYVPEEYRQWGMLGTIAVLLLARWIGVSSEELVLVSGMVGVKVPPQPPEGVSSQVQPADPVVFEIAKSSFPDKFRRFLL